MELSTLKNDVLSRLPEEPGLNEWNILLSFRGSISHNCYVPNSDPNSIDDIDLIGICIPPVDYYFGLKEYGSRGTVEVKEGNLDIVVYEIRKLINMLSGCNPNVLSLLFLKPEHYLNISPAGQLLLDNKNLFLSKEVYHSFIGYAHNQFKEMKKDTKSGYMGAKRQLLIEKYHYDVKNAAHLIRLLRMGEEILSTNTVNVYREDREQLLEIKTGKWSFEEVCEEAARLFNRCEQAEITSVLPQYNDRNKINVLCTNIIKLHFEF